VVFVKEKAVQKTDSSHNGNENEHIEEVMNQKGIQLIFLINEALSDEDSSKINQIIINKEAKPGDIYTYYENKKISWVGIQRLLNLDTTEKVLSKRWINNEVINFYFKKYLAEMVQKRCQEEPE
jgi:hypothetical protein